MSESKYEQVVRRMVAAAGHTTQSLGVGRVLGQIFAFLYFSREPQSLDGLTKALGISKGSASMGVRQLEQWGAVEKVWVRGDRKDYYKARDAFGKIIRNAMVDLAGKRLENSSALLDEVETAMKNQHAAKGDKGDAFLRDRIAKLRVFQRKSRGLWENVVLKLLLK